MGRPATYATVSLCRGHVEVARWELPGPAEPDLTVVDELARLHLAARRLGYSLHVGNACPALRQLLALAGLHGVVAEHFPGCGS